MTRRTRITLAAFALACVLAGIAAFMIVSAGTASAGQSGGFAPYARQGIINQLNRIYGPGGNPYKVTCSEVDSFGNTTGVNDSIVCHVRSITP